MASPPLSVRAYLAATHLVPLLARRHLKKRVAKGKEDADRWTEKLGTPSLPRPSGKLIWLHAVGLGEVLSLRGLITMMADQTDAHFLVTSGTKAGADAFLKNAPPRTIHQFLPLDAPAFRDAFLKHWRPDLCIWVEQDIWPGFVHDIAALGIPQALIAARMNAESHAKHARAKSLFQYVYAQMSLVTAQDTNTAQHLTSLGAQSVTVTGSLKSGAPPLTCDSDALAAFETQLADRFVWMTAPAHQADVDLAVAAHQLILKEQPTALLIIAPRFPNTPLQIDLHYTSRSAGEGPDGHIWLADTLGELGLFYRLADAVLIGGTNDATEGHNPWEAVALETAVFHGPRIANFQADYAALGGQPVTSPQELAKGLRGDLKASILAATQARQLHLTATQDLAQSLTKLVSHD